MGVFILQEFYLRYMQNNNCPAGCRKCAEQTCRCQKILSDSGGEINALLNLFRQTPFLPLCRFVMLGSGGKSGGRLTWAPLYLENKEDSLRKIRENAAALTFLAQGGIISLDYDIPLPECDYSLWEESAAFVHFKSLLYKKEKNPRLLFDTVIIEKGSAALLQALNKTEDRS
jgi:hypothetical protein